jgi:hypothetical protein
MLGKDPASVMYAASAEISSIRHNHKIKTRSTTLRKGSKAKVYCYHLMELINLLMNGRMPTNPDKVFMSAVSPLVRWIMLKWKIGGLDAGQFSPPFE